jgi:hypothetical protein
MFAKTDWGHLENDDPSDPNDPNDPRICFNLLVKFFYKPQDRNDPRIFLVMISSLSNVCQDRLGSFM